MKTLLEKLAALRGTDSATHDDAEIVVVSTEDLKDARGGFGKVEGGCIPDPELEYR